MKFHHVSLNVGNYDESYAFYAALGFNLYCEWITDKSMDPENAGMRNCFLALNGEPVVELHERRQQDDSCGVQEHFCFIADSDEEVLHIYGKALSMGAGVIKEPFIVDLPCVPRALTGVYVTHIKGPSGEHIELICWHGWKPEG